MSDFLKLKKEVSETTADIEPDDVLSVKNKLKGFGYYKEPEYGMTKFGDSQMFEGIRKFQTDNKLKVDGVMKPKGETETTFNKILRKGKYASSSIQQGLSLGWADEIEGAIGGTVYGVGDKITDKGSFADGYKRGYAKYRDERRNVLNEGYKREPVLMGISEVAGAAVTPVKIPKIPSSAPLKVMDKKNLLNVFSNGSLYGAGISEDNVDDYAKNIGRGILGNLLGYGLGKAFYGRGDNRSIARTVMSLASDKTVSSVYDVIQRNKK